MEGFLCIQHCAKDFIVHGYFEPRRSQCYFHLNVRESANKGTESRFPGCVKWFSESQAKGK